MWSLNPPGYMTKDMLPRKTALGCMTEIHLIFFVLFLASQRQPIQPSRGGWAMTPPFFSFPILEPLMASQLLLFLPGLEAATCLCGNKNLLCAEDLVSGCVVCQLQRPFTDKKKLICWKRTESTYIRVPRNISN